ncbi:hypothetical protein F4861DRAFT_512308 [Xylaria intraflava]|nr:hypothetical protein F4861DRAFT_512308 [Xylaria intraflava]
MKNLSTLIIAQIAALVTSVSAVPFSPYAWRLPSEESNLYFFGTPINAAGGKFYINRESSTYCPDGVSGLDCSAFDGTGTSLEVNDDTTIGLVVTVPGGQPVYVAPDGSLSYTQAHSIYIPPGSIADGFALPLAPHLGKPTLIFQGRTWYLCPVTPDETVDGIFQVFATPAADNCVSTEILGYPPAPGNVWQYTS